MCIRDSLINIEMPQSYRTSSFQPEDPNSWRKDPKQIGPSLMLMDLATHLHHIMLYISNLEVKEVFGESSNLIKEKEGDDNLTVLLRFSNGARGVLWTSSSATGNEHGMRIRISGDKGSLDWLEKKPNDLIFKPNEQPHITFQKGGPGLYDEAKRGTRMSWGHPEGYMEAFGNLYNDIFEAIKAEDSKETIDGLPNGKDGAKSIIFAEAVLKSNETGQWITIEEEKV